jgi:hypothetical protein
MKGLFLALLPLSYGCETRSIDFGQNAPDATIRASMSYTMEGTSCTSGFCVFPRASTNAVRVSAAPTTHHMVVQSCHRFDVLQVKTPFEYRYTPGFWIENVGSCVLFLTAIREDGSKRLAIADFTGNEQAPATVHCNGTRAKFDGASVCQSKAGLIQSVWFEQSAVVYSPDRCPKPRMDGNGSRWEYNIGTGLCVYLFVLKDGARHRHTTWGFNDAAIDP